MEYKVNDNGRVGEIIIKGEIRYLNHDALFEATSLINNNKIEELIINLEDVHFIDSAALGMFLSLNETAKNNNIKLVLRGIKGKVRAIIEATKLDEILTIE